MTPLPEPLIVTAHAVVRYLERAMGVNTEPLRRQWQSFADRRSPRPIVNDLPEADFVNFLDRENWIDAAHLRSRIAHDAHRLACGEVLPFGMILAKNRILTIITHDMRAKKGKRANGSLCLINKARKVAA